MTRKIVINRSYGGFRLSKDVIKLYKQKTGLTRVKGRIGDEIGRDDPALIEAIEELGVDRAGDHNMIKIVEIPEDVSWEIQDYDGIEWVAEKHRTWC